jgi:phenylacetate-CoA ligase
MKNRIVGYRHPDIECVDRQEILRIQDEKLARMGARLSTRSEWIEHFARSGLSPRDLADRSALAALQTLEKSDLRNRYPYPFLGVPQGEVVRFFATSGTTGLPVLFGFTVRDLDQLLAFQMTRIFRCAGLALGDRVYQGHGYGLWIGGPAMDVGLKALGIVNFPVGPGRGELGARWLRDLQITGCIMSPLWLARLAEIARSEGIEPKRDWRLAVGLFGGQSVSSGFRRHLEEQMPDGFIANNIYGTTEAGGPILGITCPFSHEDDEMHLINEDTVLTEILDPKTLQPVAPGEIGEIVVTTLDKEASPVVRWRTHDLVRLSNQPYDCPCGRRGLPRIGRVIGRSDDMLKIRSVIVFPSQVEDVVAEMSGTVKDAWQIYVDGPDEALEDVTVAIERLAGYPASAEQLSQAVRDSLHARLGLHVKVVCYDQGKLPRYDAKATRVLRTAAP